MIFNAICKCKSFQGENETLANQQAVRDAIPYFMKDVDEATRYDMGHKLKDMVQYCEVSKQLCDMEK